MQWSTEKSDTHLYINVLSNVNVRCGVRQRTQEYLSSSNPAYARARILREKKVGIVSLVYSKARDTASHSELYEPVS